MAKQPGKKLKQNFKKLFSEYKGKALELLEPFIEEQAANIIQMLKDMLKIKQMIKKCIISTIAALAATVILLLGISGVLAMYFKNIAEPWWQVIVALLTLLTISIYMKK